MSRMLAAAVAVTALWNSLAVAQAADPGARAAATVVAMTADEKTVLTHGIMPLPIGPAPTPPPADAVPGAGYVAGIPRLSVPSLKETDASLGVAYVFGIRKDGATALPSGVAMAATWNPELVRAGGAMIGAEARAKGFNVLLAGGANLMRDPRGGRTFEYLSEDPLLTGVLVGAAIDGIQSNHIISTIKHFALNGQETARKFVDVKIADAAARESDLLAFQIGIERGRPGAVMCAYNRVGGDQACASDYLLNRVLKRDWRYPGFVMSDWGAVPGLSAALGGLDQQSGAQLDPAVFFGTPLAAAARSDPAYAARVDDMNRRILWAIYDKGLDSHPAPPGGTFDRQADAAIAEQVAQKGIVLLRNQADALPLAATAKRIVVIGGYADSGVLSGGGSSQTQGEGGPAISIPLGGDGPFASFLAQSYQRSVPLAAIKSRAPTAEVVYRDGRYVSEAVAQARKADVAIVFATQWSSEGFDLPDLSLPNGQDALIDAVAEANPHTIVVLETGGPVLMPWLDRTAAVLEAWYPGTRGADAVVAVLFGDVNPSGRLPITFPASLDQLPRPKLDGFGQYEPDFAGDPKHGSERLVADYDVEGSDVGYRWYARKALKPLFPFGYGLSYTRFESSDLQIEGANATFTVRNTGPRSGATVAQLYLLARGGSAKRRLVGFQRVDLQPKEVKSVSLIIDPRLLADWKDGGWYIAPGTYKFGLAQDVEHIGSVINVSTDGKSWSDR